MFDHASKGCHLHILGMFCENIYCILRSCAISLYNRLLGIFPLKHSNMMSIRFKSTCFVPTISCTLFLPLPRPLRFRLLLSTISFSTRSRPPRFDETVLARGKNNTVLYDLSIRLDTYTIVENHLIIHKYRPDNLLSVRTYKPDPLAGIK